VEHPSYPQVPEKRIRIETVVNGMLISSLPSGGCQIEWVFQNDIKGSVPQVFVGKSVVKKMFESVQKWQDACL